MRTVERVRFRLALAALAAIGAAATVPGSASAHQHGCHSVHSCPSDHHTYIWFDANGQGWSCARPGSDTYDPSRDTTTIVYDGYTYYCYAYGSSPAPTVPTDTDGDGVPDSIDQCPYEANETADGCPAAEPRRPRGYRYESAESGLVTAELTYIKRRYRYTREHIKITRAGEVLVDAALPNPQDCDSRCAAFVRPYDPVGRGAVWLRDLDADGELEIVVDMWTGGASCCTWTLIYGFDASTASYKRVSEVWGSFYRLRQLGDDRRWQFVGVDQRWQYAFACGACAPLPLRIWQYDAGRISVATREWPGMVRQDARRTFRRYLRVRTHPSRPLRGTTRAVLATWVADQCLLGQCRRGLRTVRRALARGELGQFYRYDFKPFDEAYVRKLKRLLRRFDYRG
jgi:hypothetical protein